ncbi:DUF3388 domain-containing protein [Terrilactibacillus sp. BCM23-1]|uniref:DUF3388 domain-containing protein n=1 Tax=Terrilactibacillus tamarindi TaxID=2599694 RepID=A0A6N8CWA7_9BACI|nr:DUF3388 domain-containing protein [Terrilactibacillus tamarindi]MTT32876.1 DUF3388 domain-containing protein [Terrilactibacillus tamarindi]
MNFPVIKIIEHPDVFVKDNEYSLEDFDYLIE